MPGVFDGVYYTPNLYTRTMFHQVQSVLQCNGYVTYDTLRELGVRAGRQYVLTHFNDNGSSSNNIFSNNNK